MTSGGEEGAMHKGNDTHAKTRRQKILAELTFDTSVHDIYNPDLSEYSVSEI